MDRVMPPEVVEPARITVVHGRSPSFHYPSVGPAAWRAIERRIPWAEFRYLDDRDLSTIRATVSERRTHALVVASGALQTPAISELFAATDFRHELTSAVGRGLGVVVLRQYLGHQESLRLFDDDSTAAGRILHVGTPATMPRLPTIGWGTFGLSPEERVRIDAALEHAATEDRSASNLWGTWVADLPDRWTVQLRASHEGQTLILLGYSEVGSGRITMSALPIDNWGIHDLLAPIVVQSVRPSGLACIEVQSRAEDDLDLLLARNAHTASGGFCVRVPVEEIDQVDWSSRDLTQFRHALVAGAGFEALGGLSQRDLRRRLENRGSIIARSTTVIGSPLLRIEEGPAYVLLARRIESWFLLNFSGEPQLMTFDLLAAARLGVAVAASFEDAGAIPPNLRPGFVRSLIEPLARRRLSRDADVDGLAIPTLTIAATLALLETHEDPAALRILARCEELDDPTEPAQAGYLRALIGAPQHEAAIDTSDLWGVLTDIRLRGRVPTAEELRRVTADAEDDLAAALVVLELADADRAHDIDQEMLGRLVATLQQTLTFARRADSTPIESVLLSGAALIRLAAKRETTFAPRSLLSDWGRERPAQDAEQDDPELAEAGWRERLGQELESARAAMLKERRERDEELLAALPTVRFAVLASASLASALLVFASVSAVLVAARSSQEAMWGALAVVGLIVPAVLHTIWVQKQPFGAFGVRPADFLRPTALLVEGIRSAPRPRRLPGSRSPDPLSAHDDRA